MNENKKLTPDVNRLDKTVEIRVSNIDEFRNLLDEAEDLSDKLRQKLRQLEMFDLHVTFEIPRSKDQ